jgi:hypothetical protein
MEPVETHYFGYKFRSRLEARWAVFFNCLGLKWEYEPECYKTSAGLYLPDFRVFNRYGQITFYEVKPETVTKCEKLQALNRDLSIKNMANAKEDWDYTEFFLLSGDPYNLILSDINGFRELVPDDVSTFISRGVCHGRYRGVCPNCFDVIRCQFVNIDLDYYLCLRCRHLNRKCSEFSFFENMYTCLRIEKRTKFFSIINHARHISRSFRFDLRTESPTPVI